MGLSWHDKCNEEAELQLPVRKKLHLFEEITQMNSSMKVTQHTFHKHAWINLLILSILACLYVVLQSTLL